MVKVRRAMYKKKEEEKPKPKISEFLYKKAEGRQNTFVFKGFHEQLNSITAKLSLTTDKRYGHLREDEATRYLMGFGTYESDDESKVQLTSNFIAMMNSVLKMNKSTDFKKLHSELVEYTSSYNFIVLKKDEIVDMMMNFIDSQNIEPRTHNQNNNIISVIDLLVALVKDLRTEIGFESLFTDKIFPKIISLIHVTEVELLHQIMLFFSHWFKYMLPILLKNFNKFYKVYFSVINHSNKYIRKFGAESFSHILRKVNKDKIGLFINKELCKPFVKPYKFIKLDSVDDSEMDVDTLVAQNPRISTKDNEIFTQNYCLFEKQLNKNLNSATVINPKTNKPYKFDFKQKQTWELKFTPTQILQDIGIINLLVETIYGVQKKLYTEWRTLIDVVIDNIKKWDDAQIWYVLLLRYIVLQLVTRLDVNSLHDLVSYIITNLGEVGLKNLSDSKESSLIDATILIIKDLFLFKEGYRAYSVIVVTSVGFLYKILKAQNSDKLKMNEKSLNLFTETMYIGYHNKFDEFIKIFDLTHKDTLIVKIHKLGVEHIAHFYSLAAIDKLNEKMHDFMHYEAILLSKGKISIKNYYVSKDQQKSILIFKPLARILFTLDTDKHFDTLLASFIMLKCKIDSLTPKTSPTELLELPLEFVSKINSKILSTYKEITSSQKLITNTSDLELVDNKQLLLNMYYYIKVLSLSKSIKYNSNLDIILKSFSNSILTYKKKQFLQILEKVKGETFLNYFKQDLEFSQKDSNLEQDMFKASLLYQPTLNNFYSFICIMKSLLLKIKFSDDTQVSSQELSEFDINHQYFEMLNSCMSDDSTDIVLTTPQLLDISKWLMSNKHSIRSEVAKLLYKFMNTEMLKNGYNYNPIELIKDILSSEVTIESEKTKVNNINRLMNAFKINEMGYEITMIYLHFLIGCLWIKFTPFHRTAKDAIGQLFEKYHDSINPEILRILEVLDFYLKLNGWFKRGHSHNDKVVNYVYPNTKDAFFEGLEDNCNRTNIYKILEIKAEQSMEIMTVFDNLLGGVQSGIENVPLSIQTSYTERFINFLNNEYYVYHSTASNFDESSLKIWKSDNDLLDNLVDSNTIKSSGDFLLFRHNSDKKLVSYLKVLQDVDAIQDELVKLLSSRETEVQELALKLLWKSSIPEIKHYSKTLESFVSDTEFKDELSKFSLTENLKPQHRKAVLPLIIRILVSKLHRKVGKLARKSLDSKRSAIYRFLSSIENDEFSILINLMIEPFKIKLSDVNDVEMIETKLSKCHFRMFQGYTSSLEGIIRHLGSLVEDHLPILFTILISIYKLTRIFYKNTKTIDEEQKVETDLPEDIIEEDDEQELSDEEENNQVGHLKKDTLRRLLQISKLVLDRINEIYEKYFYIDYIQNGFSKQVLSILKENISLFRYQNITSRSAMLDIFTTWSKHANLHFLFKESEAFTQLCETLSIEKINIVHHDVYTGIFIILKNIVLAATGTSDIDKRDTIITQNIAENKAKDVKMEGEESDHSEFLEEDEESEPEDIIQVQDDIDRNLSLKIIQTNMSTLITSIASFLQCNWDTIKTGIITKRQGNALLSRFDRTSAEKLVTNSDVFKQKVFVKRIVYILSEISAHVNLDQKEILEKLANMLIPLVTIKGFISGSREELINHTFLTIQRLCEKMPSLMTLTRFYKISRLLADRLRISTRLQILDLLYVIPDLKIKESVDLVKDMNHKKHGKATLEYDFDAALRASNKFADDYLKSRNYDQTVVGLFNLLCWSEELSIRTASVHAFEIFFDRYVKDVKEYALDDMRPDTNDIVSRSKFIKFHFLPCILINISTMSNEMKLKAWFKVLRKYLESISELLSNPSISEISRELEIPDDYLDLASTISNTDENIDFFHNILNIKLQRRYKAIRQLCDKIESGEISSIKTISKVILLIADMFVLRLNEYKKKERGVVKYTKESLLQINNECFILYEKVSSVLPWSKYQYIIKKHIIKVTGLNLQKGERMSKTSEKTVTKVICAMINGFNFQVPDVCQELERKIQNENHVYDITQNAHSIFKRKQKDEESDHEDEKLEHPDEEPEDDNLDTVQVAKQIDMILESKEEDIENKDLTEIVRTRIEKSFIPALFKHLTDRNRNKYKKEEDLKIRIYVAECIVKLLRKTNTKFFNDNLSKLIKTIVVSLKSKLLSIRDLARDALTKVNLNLSPYLLHITIDQMYKTLYKGHQRHVRSYTVHHILETCVKEGHLKVGQIDHCLGKYVPSDEVTKLSVAKYQNAILKIVMDDLFSTITDEKELGQGETATKHKHSKESKANRTLATYEILSKFINFERSFVNLILPVVSKADEATSQTDFKKCEEIMDVVSGAILKNETIKAEPLLALLYTIMKRGTKENDLDEENEIIEDEKFSKQTKKQMMKTTTKVLPSFANENKVVKKKANFMSKKLLVAFALNTLKKSIGVLPIEEYKDKLDSFCEHYIHLMKSTDNKIVVNTLHLLSKWIKLNLPSIKFYIRKIINSLFVWFQNTSDSDFMNSLFKCTAELVRCMRNELSDFHINKLVEIIKMNLEHYSMQANVYGCLKALIEKKVLTADVYDLIEIIGDKMITNINKGVRSTCSKIYVQFLIEYPLENKRIEQHVYHLIKNINYFDHDGRMTVLEVIERIVNRFPTEILDKYAFILFLSLILRTVNEKMGELKQKANTVLKDLLVNISDSKRDDIIKTVLNWDFNNKSSESAAYESMNGQLQESMLKRVSFLLIGLIMTIEGSKFASKHFDRTLNLVTSELTYQNDKFKQILAQTQNEEIDIDERSRLEIVKKQMGDFFEDIDQMIDDEIGNTKKIVEEVSKQDLITAITAISVFDKINQDPVLWKKFYKTWLSNKEGYEIVNTFLEFSKLVWMFISNSSDTTFTALRSTIYKIITKWFENMEKDGEGYKSNASVSKLIDDLSIIIVKHYNFDDQVISMSIFTVLHILDRTDDSNRIQKLEKIFNMCSYHGRRIMMNLKRDISQLVCIMRFFITILTTIKDLEVLKCISKPILHLAYKMYTNPQLNESETKVISAELVEILQNKLDHYDNTFGGSEEKSVANSSFIQLYNEVKKSSEVSKLEAKAKRSVNRINDIDRFKRKRSQKRKNKRESAKLDRQKYV